MIIYLKETMMGITKQEILNRLEEIADSMDSDFMNRYAIEGVLKDIKELQWKINTGLKISID